jgi:hypothetical protein
MTRGWAALAGMQSGSFQLRRFRELFFRLVQLFPMFSLAISNGPAFSGSETSFFRFRLMRKLFIDLGRNLKDKSSIPREIQGIRARKFVEM